MLTKDQKYYGIPEEEVVLRSIAKKERWLIANAAKQQGVTKRIVIANLLRRIVLLNSIVREKREKEKP